MADALMMIRASAKAVEVRFRVLVVGLGHDHGPSQ